MLVYKACSKSIVTLELLEDSKTNQNRHDVVNPDFAKFRTNKAKVINLVNPETKEELEADNSTYEPSFIYSKGKIVEEPNYDDHLDHIFTEGIHYFKTYEGALSWFYRKLRFNDASRVFAKVHVNIGYHHDGSKEYEIPYKDGEKDGTEVHWYTNGALESVCYYKNGKKDGKEISWYYNGVKSNEDNYKNGIAHGIHTAWYEDSKKSYEDEYKDNILIKSTCWHPNGMKESEIIDGKQYRWNEFGREL